MYSPRVRGTAAVCCLVTAIASLSGPRAQTPGPQSYRDVVEEVRAHPDAAIPRVLDLPDEIVARGIADAIRPGTVWPLPARAAAILLHVDAALYLLARDRSAAWTHIERAQTLGDALAMDPESAWLVHQSLTVIRIAFRDDLKLKPLVDRWRAEPWFTATAAMDRGLDLELNGAEFGLSTTTRGARADVYDPDAFRQAEPFYRQAVAAHLQIAAVHLGRIELLRGRFDEARALFDQAAHESHWRTTIYLANLFLGSVDEHDNEWMSAERRYKAAVAAIETAQSGRLALAALLGRNGRGAEAARLLAARPGVSASFDPWWAYLHPYEDRRSGIGMILSELHMAVGQ
jgi:tetratricopeptide (TPR) repeat protein